MKKNILFLLILLSASRSFSQVLDESSTVFIDKAYTAQIKEATDSINKMMKKKQIPGLSVCVSIKGKIVWAQGFGFSDLENGSPVKLNTKFRIGSVSKTVTAIAVGELLDAGKISLDSNITKYVPYWPEKKYKITVGQIGSHVAGIRHYRGNEFLSAVHYNSVEESINIFKNDSLLVPPGTVHIYSSYGYNLLSAAIEGASGHTYLDYVRDNIFSPLDMHNSVFDYNDSIIPNRTRFYEVIKNKFLGNAPYVDNSNKWGSGGILSTPYDLVKLGNALLTHKIISANALTTLWTPYVVTGKVPNVYGIGFRVEKNKAGQAIMSHGGTSIGGRTYFILYPKEQVVMAITYNLLPAGYNEVELSDIFARGL